MQVTVILPLSVLFLAANVDAAGENFLPSQHNGAVCVGLGYRAFPECYGFGLKIERPLSPVNINSQKPEKLYVAPSISMQEYENIFAEASQMKSAREGVYHLLSYRGSLNSISDFDSFLKQKGIYLDKLFVAKRKIVLVSQKLIDYKDPIGDAGSKLGLDFLSNKLTVDTYGVFASSVGAGELLYNTSGSNYRGLISANNISDISDSIDAKKAEGSEVFGSIDYFSKEFNLDKDALVKPALQEHGIKKPTGYDLTRLVSTDTKLGGDIIDFIEEHPIASLAAAGTLAYYLAEDNETSSKQTSSQVSSDVQNNTSSPKVTWISPNDVTNMTREAKQSIKDNYKKKQDERLERVFGTSPSK